MDVTGKAILVVGVARSGVAAARLLTSRGARVTANDNRPEGEVVKAAPGLVAGVEALRQAGVRFVFGSHPEEIFLSSELIVLSPGVPADIAPLQKAREAG